MEEKKQCRGLIHKVKSGDTLYGIARMHGVKVRDLMLANPYVDVYQLQVGDELCVPIFPAGGMRPQEGMRPYIVKKDETLGSVIENTGISCEELVKYNKNISELPVGEGIVLIIPTKIQPRNEENEQREDANS